MSQGLHQIVLHVMNELKKKSEGAFDKSQAKRSGGSWQSGYVQKLIAEDKLRAKKQFKPSAVRNPSEHIKAMAPVKTKKSKK